MDASAHPTAGGSDELSRESSASKKAVPERDLCSSLSAAACAQADKGALSRQSTVPPTAGGGTSKVATFTRDDVVRIFVNDSESAFTADIKWASAIPKSYAQLYKLANEPGVDLDDLKTQEKWVASVSAITKIPMNPSKFVDTTYPPHVADVHSIAQLIREQDDEKSFLFEIKLDDGNGRLICIKDKYHACKIKENMEKIEKPLWIKLHNWSSDGLSLNELNASSGGPNLWWMGSEGIMNISQLSVEKRESLKNAMQKHMEFITTKVVQHMASVCDSDSSRASFNANGFTDEEITLFVKHMKIKGAMDLLLTMQASDGNGCANTSVPIPHMQTNPGFQRAYLEEIDLSKPDLEERTRLAEINTRMMQIFATQNGSRYKEQMRFPFK